MIIEEHYDHESLIGMLGEGHRSEAHLASCETCAATLRSYGDLTQALSDKSVWDEGELSEDPRVETTSMLRSFAAASRAEDDAAKSIVATLLDAGSLQRRAHLAANPQWRTAGVVRRLLEAVDKSNFVDPKAAADWAQLAVEIADSLDSKCYPFDTAIKLRVKAQRTHAHMLYCTGAYLESIEALDRTDALVGECIVGDYDAARAWLVRAQVYNEIERLDEAMSLADSARQVFRKFADVRREAVAEATKAGALFYARRFAEALPIFERLAADTRIEESSRAFYIHDAAICRLELGHLAQSKPLFVRAIAEFERLGMAAMRARARWQLGHVLFAEGQHAHAYALFAELRAEFEELGMAQDVALISIDAAEALLTLGRSAEVAQLCQAAMAYFTRARLAYTQGALTALAYLREAAEAQSITAKGLGELRAYFQALPKQPVLLFAYRA